MGFLNYGCDSPVEYKEFIKEHKYEKTDKAIWKKCKNIIPYAESFIREGEDKEKYFEFVDDKLNFYVDFFEIKTGKWLESYKYKDIETCWTAFIDNMFYGNPLKIDKNKTFEEIFGE